VSGDEDASWLRQALTPLPLDASGSSRDLVCSSINFERPERLPYSLINPVRSDFFELASLVWRERYAQQKNLKPKGEVYYDEWNIKRERVEGLFDLVIEYPLSDLAKLDGYAFPQIPCPEISTKHSQAISQAFEAEKYVLGYDAVNLYDRVVSLAGLQTALLGPHQSRLLFESLLDELTALTLTQIEHYGRTGKVQGFMTWQDFGSQKSLVMSLRDFRRFYRPRIQQMIDALHAQDMHFIWHCCGAIADLIPEMIEMGVDVVQLDQARLIGYDELSRRFGGKICFWNALDTLWVTQAERTDKEISTELSSMREALDRFGGGLMLRHYPQPEDIGLSVHVQDVIAEQVSCPQY
jgi:uroporphyrinogen decarboxylase